MTSFDYRLNPLYPIKECSSCGALYTTDYCCSEGILEDKIICDLDKTPDLSQRSPQNCPKCENPVNGHYCQGCALLRKKFNEDLFTSCVENGILQDSFEPSNYNTTVVNALREPFVVNQDPDGNSFTYDSISNLVHDSPNVFDPPPQPPLYSEQLTSMCDMVGQYTQKKEEEKQIEEEQAAQYWKISACYDDDDDDDFTIEITHKEPDNSLIMRDEHLDTIPATKSDKFIKSSVENRVSNPSESEGEYECDVPACKVLTTFLNILFDADYDFYSDDNQSFSDEDIPKEIYSNPLFDEEIISMKIDPHHFNAESDLIESLLNHDSSIISSSSKIDSLFDEFAEEIDLFFTPDGPMSPSIDEDDYDSERDILILEELLDNNSLSFPKNESFHFDIPLSYRPPTKPPDGNT
uniref:Pre-mRNA splicing Prp18-interacting factor n=1 Tax=Tanacetum cinerariifolium TaxID=118510 RepID=A0A6L2LDG6_TANCI|nr:hypothetical protein [Tanacetum cinerariifolium]